MLDAVVAFGSTFMLLQTYIGAHSAPQEIGKLVEYSSPLRYQIEFITMDGQCFSGVRNVPCHLIMAGCKIHCMLDWVVLFPIFYGMALLAVAFVGVTHHFMDDEANDDAPKKYVKELTGFTTFLLGLSSITGLSASGVGLAMLVMPMTGPSVNKGMNVYVGWAELITIGLTVCQMMLTLSFFNQSRHALTQREGGIILDTPGTAEQTQPLLEKPDDALTQDQIDNLVLTHSIYA